MSHDFDATRLSLLLNDLRLPAIKQIWSSFAERSDTEGWPAARLLMALAEHEIAERDRRRIERHLRRCCGGGGDSGDFVRAGEIDGERDRRPPHVGGDGDVRR